MCVTFCIEREGEGKRERERDIQRQRGTETDGDRQTIITLLKNKSTLKN